MVSSRPRPALSTGFWVETLRLAVNRTRGPLGRPRPTSPAGSRLDQGATSEGRLEEPQGDEMAGKTARHRSATVTAPKESSIVAGWASQ